MNSAIEVGDEVLADVPLRGVPGRTTVRAHVTLVRDNGTIRVRYFTRLGRERNDVTRTFTKVEKAKVEHA